MVLSCLALFQLSLLLASLQNGNLFLPLKA